MEWRDAVDIEFDVLNQILKDVMVGIVGEMPLYHQVGSRDLDVIHIYFHSRSNGLGGVWIWSSNHGFYVHGSIRPPVWWANPDIVDEGRLSAQPIYLDVMSDRIDDHWNEAIRERLPKV